MSGNFRCPCSTQRFVSLLCLTFLCTSHIISNDRLRSGIRLTLWRKMTIFQLVWNQKWPPFLFNLAFLLSFTTRNFMNWEHLLSFIVWNKQVTQESTTQQLRYEWSHFRILSTDLSHFTIELSVRATGFKINTEAAIYIVNQDKSDLQFVQFVCVSACWFVNNHKAGRAVQEAGG